VSTPNLVLEGGAFQTFEGQTLSFGYLIMQLSHDAEYVAGPYQVVAGLKLKIQLDSSGNINPTVNVYSNDVLSPSGSFYTVMAYKSDGTAAWADQQYWILSSSPNPLNTGSIPPNNPPGFLPPIFLPRTGAIEYVIDGGGSVIGTGSYGQVNIPNDCVVTGWVLTADQTGSAVVDVLTSSFAAFPTVTSIAGADKPTITSAIKGENLAVSVWNTSIPAGSQVQLYLDSISTCTRLNICLNVIITS
jgi:hypothetical protein